MESYNEQLIRWSAEEIGNEYIEINALLEFLGKILYNDYEPSIGPYPDYFSRLNKWVNNLENDDDKQNLLRIAKRIFYVGREEFNALYRSAYTTHIIRWLIDKENLDITNVNAYSVINNVLDLTWFCPVTDSLRINQFYHINQIKATHEFRPDWRSLKKFGSKEKIQSHINKKEIKYLVLLEDFVGSGTQCCSSLKFACELNQQLQVLFVPLIICPIGLNKIRDEVSEFSNFSISPVITLSADGFITKESEIGEDILLSRFRQIIENSEPIYSQSKYGFMDMGCLIVMHTNVPNNSLPLIYYQSEIKDKWHPLFKRHHRSIL